MVDDIYTQLLLHMDGADSGTSFVDESGKTITVRGNTSTKTAVKKFGTASAYFDGAGDSLTVPRTDIQFGSGDFTVDLWFNPVAQSQSYPVLWSNTSSSYDSGGIWLYAGRPGAANKYIVAICDGAFKTPIVSNATIVNGAWVHLAVVRQGNMLYLYINGVLDGSSAISIALNGYGNYFSMGIDGSLTNACSLKGYVDELRVSVGVARWTANFTPPTVAYHPPAYKASGIAVFGAFVLPEMSENPQSSAINWTQDTPANTAVAVYSAIVDGTPVEDDYTLVTNHGLIPGLAASSSGKSLYIKVVLTTSDTTATPKLLSLDYSIIEGAVDNRVHIRLTDVGRLKYPVGQVLVEYSKSIGNLVGDLSAQVDDFELSATPQVDFPIFAPNDLERVDVALSHENELIHVYYQEYQSAGDETITTELTHANIVIHVNDIDN